MSLLPSCSCICAYEDSHLFFDVPQHDHESVSGTGSYGSCYPKCYPIQRASLVFFQYSQEHNQDGIIQRTITNGYPDFNNNQKPHSWVRQRPRPPLLDLHPQEDDIDTVEPAKPRSELHIPKTHKPNTDPSVILSTASSVPKFYKGPLSLNGNQVLVLLPPSPTKTVPLIFPPSSAVRSGLMVRKFCDENREQRLEIVRKRKKEKKAEGRNLSKESKEGFCGHVRDWLEKDM